MKHLVLVREKATHKLLADDLTWVLESERAMFFASSGEAMCCCIQQHIHNAEIVLRVGPPKWDLAWEMQSF